jgi:hypothetical protein
MYKMILEPEKILLAVTMAKIKGTLATLVWEMQLANFNPIILEVVASEIYDKLEILRDPIDLEGSDWSEALDKECENFLSFETAGALSILPWFAKLDHQLIASYAYGGSRHSVMHVVGTVGLIKNKINNGVPLTKLVTDGNLDGSLPWVIVVKEIGKLAKITGTVGPMKMVQQQAKIVNLLNIAVGYEVEVMNR